MPKKYLLYIHSERFADEEKKSGLINELLDRYYEEQSRKPKFAAVKKGVFVTNGTDPLKRVDLTKRRGLDAIGVSTDAKLQVPQPVVQPLKTAGEVQEKLKQSDIDICEHGASPGFCKHSKCKNASKSA